MTNVVKYVSVFRYDYGTEFSIYNTYTSLTEAKKGWKKDVKDFLSYGPDDASTLYLFELMLNADEMKQFEQHLNIYNKDDTYSDNPEFIEYMESLYQNKGFKRITCMTCDGNYDILKMAEQDGIDEDTLWSNEKLYKKYLNRYIKQEICI